jgi:hypothetical protein
MPIMPTTFVQWYYNNASTILASLNPSLSQASVNETCSAHFECVHDYLLRINSFTSKATASALDMFQQSRLILGSIEILK